MWRKRKHLNLVAGTFIALSMLLSAVAPFLFTTPASASGTPPQGNFSYQVNCAPSCTIGSAGSTLSIVSNNVTFQNLIGDIQYSSVSGSTYTFTSTNGIKITVNGNNPGTGVWTSGSIKETISIGNTNDFTSFFQAGGATTNGSITTNLSVDFGSVDSSDASISIPDASATIECSGGSTSANCNSTLPAADSGVQATPSTLSSNPVKFTEPFSSLIVGQKYHVCFSANYIVGDDGNDGDPVCGDVTATKTGATLSLKAKGDLSVLQSDSSGNGGNLDCNFDGNPLTWVVCPIIDGAKEFINKVDSIIQSALTLNSQTIFQNVDSYHSAWNSFRIIATALLVVAGLVMVASQAIGFEVLDAYTVRKVLPRLLVAIIGISLSWPLMKFMVDFANTLGVDVRQLILSPFKSLKGDLANSPGALLTANLGLIVTGAVVGIFGALSFGLTALLALLVGFLIIIVRDLALTMIIILAPIAIACYILPNTQKGWKLWSENFLGLLLVFPIIEAFIAAGRAFSAVALANQPVWGSTGVTGTGANTLAKIIGFLAYFLPYFLLPIAFRMATGAIGSIAGFVNDQNRGAFDKLKKFRGNKAAENMHAMNTGTRFNNRALNAMTSRATTHNLGFGARGRAAYNQKLDLAAAEHAKSAAGMAIQHNDDALRALTYGSAIEARNALKAKGWNDQRIDTAIGAAKSSGGFGRTQQVYAAQQLAATGTGYENYRDVAETIARVSHGNEGQISSLAGNINSTTKSVGRYDLAAGYDTLNRMSRAESQGIMTEPQKQAAYNEATVKAARGVDAVTLLRGKPAQTKNLQQALQSHLHEQFALGMAGDAAAMDEALQTAAQIKQLGDSKSYASQENQEIVNELDRNTRGDRQGPGSIESLVKPAQIDRRTGAVIAPAGPLRDRWEQLSPMPRNMNDPNLP